MIEETVLAVDGTRITTETGGKIPIGNREFEVGESVWTDGPFAFGTQRFSGMINQIIPESKPLILPYLIELGWFDDEVKGYGYRYAIRDCTTSDVKIVATIDYVYASDPYDEPAPLAFCYDKDRNIFTTFVADNSNVIKIRTVSPDGATLQTVTVPYDSSSGGWSHHIDAYYDEYGVLHWTLLWDDLYYNHYYEGVASPIVDYDPGGHQLIFNSGGHVAFCTYIGTELQNNVDLTSTCLSKLNEAWNEVNNELSGAHMTIEGHEDFSLSGYTKVWEDTPILYTEPIIRDGNYRVRNKPDMRIGSDSIYARSWESLRANLEYGSERCLVTVCGENHRAYNFNTTVPISGTIDDIYAGTSSDHFSVGVLAEYLAFGGITIDGNGCEDIAKYRNMTIPGTSSVCSEYTGELGTVHPTTYIDANYTGTNINDTGFSDFTRNMDAGYSVTDTVAENGVTLSDGNGWTMQTDEIGVSVNANYPTYIAVLPGNKLYMHGNSDYLIDKTNKAVTYITGNQRYNTRIAVIESTLADLITILSKK